MRARAICVCRDEAVSDVIGAALESAGLDVEHCEQPPVEPGEEVALFVVDRAMREELGHDLCWLGAPVIVVGDDLEDDALIEVMLDAPVSHLLKDPGDRQLGITSEKLVTGDLFGLEKYLAGASSIRERVVTNDIEKRQTIQEVTAWAESIGARKPLVHRLASVIDELLMNALHDAPRESRPVLSMVDTRSAVVRWAADDQTIAISVSDPFGALSQRDVIDHVRRAREERGRPNPAQTDDPGAGLGLYLVMANVASLIVNVDPGRLTEVVCLFDLARRERRAIDSGVRSLHVFHAS
jgi:hypothetical protein